ncbi:MAG: hypothetical protein CMJ12_03925 [Pelagibacterales bacterium]|mgnify:CR=1 FL=1|nr:hypothetical protein [Pelagibacterales bacterium]PPR16921.1 MAG: hypothetical protein CFH33_00297 [Alphaproteobacteria bacterium MarineAlpha9_Bin3]|tara:strand:+ start:11935 stop:12366 length:432 start_codon:yes stop_codon:yes gene_type:complete
MININISKKVKNNIKQHALNEYPNECCGFIIGYIENNTMQCVDIKKSNNIANNPKNAFEIHPKDIINAIKKYRNTKLSVLGHYHSHPNSLLNSKPSKKDIDSIYDSNLCWVIIGINDKEIEYSAYMPKLLKNNTYDLEIIKII